VRGIVPAYHRGHRNGQERGVYFASLFCLLLLWRPPGQYGAIICPMAAFSGFYKSSRPPPSVNARGIAPSHCRGYRNGQRRRYIRSLSPPLSFDQNVAKRPCYGSFKLTLSYDINLIGVISLCISFWLPPPTMDAILATIVAGGRARIQQTIEVDVNKSISALI
jgi:hypothetical protein